MAETAHHPFDLLLSMAARSRAALGAGGANKEGQIALPASWTGVGFSLGGFYFVAPLGQVTEILTGITIARLPRVKPWVRGVANVRGRLLPILDLAAFFGLPPVQSGRMRVLILEIDEIYCGLMVDEAHGLRHFGAEAYRPEGAQLSDAIRPFAVGRYLSNEGSWHVFDTGKLVQDSGFLDAGLR